MNLITSGKRAVVTLLLEVPTGLRDHEVAEWAVNSFSVHGAYLGAFQGAQVQIQTMQPPPPAGPRITPP